MAQRHQKVGHPGSRPFGVPLPMSFPDFLAKELNGYMPSPEAYNGGLESRVMSHRYDRSYNFQGVWGEEERWSS